MNLFTPERHVSLPQCAWEPERVSAWLSRWAVAALQSWARDGRWPMHPRDAEDAEDADETPGPLHTLYCGSAGVWVALARLARADLCRLPMDLAEIFARIESDYVQAPDMGERVPSWFLGESGLLMARWLARPDDATAERLAAIIRANRDNATREALWGAPGTMVAALFLHETAPDPRWAALFRDSAEAIWASWLYDEAEGVWLWEQDMYGQQTRYLGAGHGWAGNLYPLWRGHALLSPEQQIQLRERTLRGLEKLAVTEGNLANWPTFPDRSERLLVQWCHGAPGLITSLRHAVLPEALPLLMQCANLIVKAGPLAKGVALCHGGAGNGAALLELHRRTGDADWLGQARQFAMWSIEQSEAAHAQYGQWHYSLWTGDAGLACYLLDCLLERSRGLPGLDSFW